MRRLILLAAVIAGMTGIAAVPMSKPAQAEWTSVVPGMLPDCPDNNCPTKMEVCQFWAHYYGRRCIPIWAPYYNNVGQVMGLTYDLWNPPWDTLHDITSPICPGPGPSGTAYYAGNPYTASGCPRLIQPIAKQLGNPPCKTGCANMQSDPINILIGNVYEAVTDYESAGPFKLAFVRYYNSLSHFQSSLGMGWQSNFDRAIGFASGVLAANAQHVYVRRPDGGRYTFSKSGTWAADDADVDATLTTDNATIWTYTDDKDTVETYDFNTGHLLSIQLRGGYRQTLTYDGSGQLASVTDSFGRQLTFTFANGTVQSMTDPDGRVYAYTYASVLLPSDQLLQVTYPGTPAPTVQYVYENATFPFAMTGVIDENGNRAATWGYDAATNLAISAQGAGGADAITVSYNIASGGGGTVTTTNALGKTTVYTLANVQNANKVTQIVEQASANSPATTRSFNYGGTGFVNRRTDANGNVTAYFNDPRGQWLTKTDALGNVTTYTWHATFHLPTQIVEPGRTTNFTYDSNGLLLTKTEIDTTTATVPYSTNGRTRSWTYTYTAPGLLTTATGPRTDVTDTFTFAYDATGVVTSVTNALGQVTQVTSHDASGRPLTLVDANGVSTNLTYDTRGRLLTKAVATAAGNAVTALAYDAVGNVTEVTAPDGSSLAYTYDAANRLTKVTNALGETITYTLDALGDRTQVQIATSGGTITKTQSQVFDELGRLLQSIGAAGQTTSNAYDHEGNLASITDPLSQVTGQSFDALNRLIKTAAPLSATTSYAYDARDNRTKVTDPRGLVTTYVFDGLDDLIQVSSPDTGTTVYHVDAAGNRTQQANAAGNVTNFTYDALNRVTAETFPNDAAENVAYTYDQAGAGFSVGRLTSVTDASGSTAHVYDEQGHVTQETAVIGGVSYVTTYAYDLAGHVIAVTYPSGRIVSYSRDAAGRITGVATQANAGAAAQNVATGASYMPFGPLASLTYGNGLALSVQYDQDYQPSARLVSGVAIVQDLTYGLDAAGNITGTSDLLASVRSQTIQYDALSRLTSATGVYGTYTYTYDAVGNRTSQALTASSGSFSESYHYAANSNQLQSVVAGATTRTLAYGATGNVTSSSFGSGAGLNYAYNQNNRLVQVTSGGVAVASYAHNFLGQRVIKATPAATTVFHYDRAGHLLAESDGSGNVLAEHLWLGDTPVGFVAAGTLYYVHPDHLATPQKITDGTQTIVWDTAVAPFGQVALSLPGLGENLRFPGQYADAETGLSYNYFRDYDPNIGRYTESDPIGLEGGANTYEYVGGDPVNWVDPLGLLPTIGGPLNPSSPSLQSDEGEISPICQNAPKEAPPKLLLIGKKTSPKFKCVACGAIHGGLRGPYCPDCYIKSLDPKGGIPPLVIPLDK